LIGAPTEVIAFFKQLTRARIIELTFDEESELLSREYIKEQIVGLKSLVDCQHIATATVNNIDILVSWNFKHIVNLDKIRLYNAVNLKKGYKPIEIRTPREIFKRDIKMKTNIKTEKTFDAVKMMRDIRNKIDKELEGMTSEQVLKYYEDRRRRIRESKK